MAQPVCASAVFSDTYSLGYQIPWIPWLGEAFRRIRLIVCLSYAELRVGRPLTTSKTLRIKTATSPTVNVGLSHVEDDKVSMRGLIRRQSEKSGAVLERVIGDTANAEYDNMLRA